MPNTFAAGDDRDVARTRTNVIDDGTLYPWNEEMCALANDVILDARKTIEDNCSRAAID